MARDTLPSPIEAALAKAPSFGLPESFQKSQEGRQQVTFEPGNVPFQSDFASASQKYGVPVNVLMALAQQESSFNPTALGQPTKWGRAKGLMQYLDSTAAGMGINPYDPRQAIDAAAKQLKQRLDKGYSIQEAISAHFGGDDRKQWGPKTRQYGVDVLNKAQTFFDGTQGQIKQPAQTQRDFAAEYPAAQSAMENMEQNDLRARAIETQNVLDQLNAEEPGRYRPLTASEMAQVQQQQESDIIGKANQLQQDVKAITQPVSIPEHMAQEEQKQKAQTAKQQGIMDNALEMGADVMNLLQSGVNIAAKDTKELVSRVPLIGKPIVNAADRFDRWANGKSSEEIFKEWDKSTEKAYSPELAAARKKAWVVEPGDDIGGGKKATGYSFGPAWSDPRAYMSGILESLPEMAVTMGGSGRLAAMAFKRAIASGASREVAAKAAARTATVAGGILEGGLGGAQSARETREQINQMTPYQLKDSQALKSLMDGGKTFEQARYELAENAASKAFLLAGVGTGIFGGMGDRAMAKIITGNAGGRLKSALTGAIGEGLFEEAPQSALQQMGQNYAMQEADPNTPLMKGVANQVAGGAALGGMMGGGMGLAAPRVSQQQDATPAETTPVQAAPTDPAAQMQDAATDAAPTPPRDDSGLSDDAGPLERAVRGTADQPTAANGNLWAGEPGNAINIQAKGDPSTAMDVTIDRYENDGSVTVRDGTGTPYTVTHDDIDINLPQAEQAAVSVEETQQQEVIPEVQQVEQVQQTTADGMTIDPSTGEIIGGKPVVREIEAARERPLTEMSEDELRDRMRYIAQQAKQNGGMDKRLMDARRQVEKALNAKVKDRESGNAVDDFGLTKTESLRLKELLNKSKRTAEETAEAKRLNDKSAEFLNRGNSENDGETVGNEGMTIVHGSGNPNLTADDIQIIRPEGQKQGKKGRVYGGFYGTRAEDAAQAEGYAGMMGGTPTVYDVNIKPGTKVFRKEGDITRLSENTINDLVSKGYGVVVGTDPRGRTEYAVIDKNAIAGLKQRGSQNAEIQQEQRNEQPVAGGRTTVSGDAATTDASPALIGGDGKPKWFSTQDKAKAFIDRRKLDGYDAVQVKPNRFEIHKVEQPAQAETSGTLTNEGTKAEAPKLPKGKKESPRVNRARKVVGAEGNIVSPSGDVGYAKAGGKYKITGIDKNGTIHLTNQETGGGTSISVSEMESGRSRNVTWNKTEPVAKSTAETVAETKTAPQQEQRNERKPPRDGVVESGEQLYSMSGRKLSPAPKIDTTGPQKLSNSTKRLNNWMYEEAVKEAQETGNDWNATLLKAINPNRMSQSDQDTVNSLLFGDPEGPTAKNRSASARQNEQQNIPENIPETRETPRITVGKDDRSWVNQNAQQDRDRADNAGLTTDIEKLFAEGKTVAQVEKELSDRLNFVDKEDRAGFITGVRATLGIPSRSTQEGKAEFDAWKKGYDASQVTEQPQEAAKSAEYGANNKLVSQDRAAELRQRLKAKFSQLNSGIDPEILAIGTELAVFHIEAGVRKFADFAKAMANDLDLPLNRVRPYLRSWYNGARDMMEDSGVSIDGMDTAETVRSELAKLNEQPAASNDQPTAPAAQQAEAPKSNTRQPSRATGAMDDMVSQFDNEVPNVSTPRTGLEPDSATAGNAKSVNESANVDGTAADGRSAAAASRRADAERGTGQRDQRVSDDGATAGRESGDQRVHREDGQFRPSQGVSGSDLRTGSAGRSEAGLSTERTRAAAVAANAHASGAGEFAQRLAAQKKAPKETKWGDTDSVRASLPMLLPAQQDDVVKVEQRYQKDNGIVITNGTGTGKTMSGLGVAKRFHNAGKENILVVVPSDKIASDWVKSAGWLNLPMKQLNGITDNGGSGPVVTTYANMGQNSALANRQWDLIIPDESHRLMQNESGDVTDQLRMFRALTGHPDGFSTYMQAKHADQYAKLTEADHATVKDRTENNQTAAAQKREQAYQQQLAAWNALYKDEQAKWRERWTAQKDMTKVVFMSATPFAYVPNTDYAEGFLFHHVPPADRFNDRSQGGYNSGNPRDLFYIQHFGYRMRYNRLTRPDAEVNSELMEQNFNQYLKDTGALIGRSLDVPFDYDRKFILIDDAAGKKLDQALEYLNNGENGMYRNIYSAVMDTFDHQRKMFLLESMKARAAVPIIKQHLALGRKVLVVHDYNQGGGFNPFAESLKDMDPALRPIARELFQKPIFRINFSGLDSALNTLLAAFPKALTFNGTVPKAKRRANADKFNDDLMGPNILIAQSDAMREGVSVHDTSGKHQRVEINLGLPTQPTKSIQLEGRIYRTGQASDAIFRYMTTGTAWEANAFASKLAERASTAENLAMGPDSRALKQSFIDSYQDASAISASKTDGRGGKAADKRASNEISEFDKAKTYYFAQQKNSKARGDREGVDYFATPEPVGMKMVEWANIKPGDKVLEPSAGHGAIARFFPAQTDVTMVEPSLNLSQRAALANGGARIVNSRFEDLNRTNKYDAIVMNPPYGMGGKTAYEHLDKAMQHLREGGRIVALVPRGGLADRRFVDFIANAEENGVHLVADIAMPRATFERAGTQVNTRVLVLEKNTSEDYQTPEVQTEDLSGAETVTDLFNEIENLSVSEREVRQQQADNLQSFRREQTASEFSDQLKLQYPGLKIGLTGSGEVVTLQRIELPAESRNLGTGTQIMQQITSWADSNGKTVALTPSSDFGGNKARLNEFYKRFGFVDNKGRNKDYAISETMYREPQQADLPSFTNNQRQASTEDLEALNRTRGTEGQAIPANKFAELVGRIEESQQQGKSNPEKVLEALRKAEKSGVYSKEGAQLAAWLVRQYPHIANDLNLELAKGNNSTPAGNYNVTNRLVSLFSDFARDGAPVRSTDAITATHEILHHMERMLPRNVQREIAKEWTQALEKRMQEYSDAGDSRREHLLADLVAGMYGDREALNRARDAFTTGEMPNSDYQYASPSEYWAENGARIIADRKARADAPKTWVDRAVEAMRAIFNRIKVILGIKSDNPNVLMQALDSVLAGDGKFVNDSIIARTGDDMYGLSQQFGDYQAPNLQSLRSGLEPNPNIPTQEQDNARINSWWDRLKNLPADKMTDAMKHTLAALPLRPLVTELGKNVPSLGNYMLLKQSMDAMRNKWHAKTDATAKKWLKYRVKHPAENAEMMELMHDATIAQVDPSESFEPAMTDRDRDALRTVAAGSEQELELIAKAAEDDRRFAAWGELNRRYNKLSPEGKEIFKEVRDAYTEITNEYEKTLLGNMEKAINVRIKRAEREHRADLQRIADEGLTGQEKADAQAEADKKLKIAKTKTAWNRKARITQLRQQFEMNRLQGPYFPLARFGDLFVTVRDKESGKVESFSRFESSREQREFAQLMRENPKYTVQVGALDDSMTTRKAVDANFVADVEDILADLPNAETVKDEVWQRYLESLPDFSIRKNRIHRTGRKGYNADALRAFGNQMFHSAHQLARLKHTYDMEEALDAAREEAGKTKDPVRDTKVVNEMEARHKFIMNPTGSSIATAATSAAFLWYLAASPSTAIRNLAQTPMLGIPIMAAYEGSSKGILRATNQFMRASADLVRGKGGVANSKNLTADERKAINAAYDMGLIDRTQAHDLAGIGETGVEYKPGRAAIMAAMSWGFHHTERINREVTTLMAYRMARAKGLTHQQAVEKANDLTWKTHFDYQNNSRPRIMHNDMMKVALVFRNYSINMLYRLFRDVHQSVKGESPEVRREARMQLAGITGMMMLGAGLTGTWGAGIIFALASAFMDDDKDPEAELKKNMVEALGPMMTGIILDGVPGYLTGTSQSESLGMPDLWFRSPSSQLDGKQEFEYWQSQLLGATPSIVSNVFRGFNLIKQGETYRGIETAAPKWIKDPMKAYRYATEGATNLKGDTIVDNVSAGDVIRQALGSTPAKLAEQYDINNRGFNLQQTILQKRQQLMNNYAKAGEKGDDAKQQEIVDQIVEFNGKYPEQAITGKSISRSMKTRAENAEMATGGMRYNRKLRDRILEDQAPRIYE